MIFNYYVSTEHEKFFSNRYNDNDPKKTVFYYVAGSAEALRKKFGQKFSAEESTIPDGMTEAERALLNLAFEIYNRDHSCNFVANFLLLDPHRQRVMIEALAQIGSTADD